MKAFHFQDGISWGEKINRFVINPKINSHYHHCTNK